MPGVPDGWVACWQPASASTSRDQPAKPAKPISRSAHTRAHAWGAQGPVTKCEAPETGVRGETGMGHGRATGLRVGSVGDLAAQEGRTRTAELYDQFIAGAECLGGGRGVRDALVGVLGPVRDERAQERAPSGARSEAKMRPDRTEHLDVTRSWGGVTACALLTPEPST